MRSKRQPQNVKYDDCEAIYGGHSINYDNPEAYGNSAEVFFFFCKNRRIDGYHGDLSDMTPLLELL